MHQDLLGYLLGALEPHEMDQVRQALRDNPELQQELEQIKALLRPLDEATDRDAAFLAEDGEAEQEDLGESFEPPRDLISRTMAAIPEAPVPGTPTPQRPVELEQAGELSGRVMVPASDQSEKRPWSWWDMVFSGLAATALFGIVLPGVLQGRFEARKIACQNNLRETGIALTNYALDDPQHQLPRLAAEGNEAFAGIYSVKLHDKQLIDRMSQILCPSLDPPNTRFLRPPTTEELQAARGQTLLVLQRLSGGSYAYNLGVMSGNRYQSPQYQGRTAFAILGDAPVPVASLPALSAGSDQGSEIRRALAEPPRMGTTAVRFGHEGRGVNLLFEDGHVIFLPVGDSMMTHDHPFLNHRGDVEAGVNADDAALAPSWQPPFRNVPRRWEWPRLWPSP